MSFNLEARLEAEAVFHGTYGGIKTARIAKGRKPWPNLLARRPICATGGNAILGPASIADGS
jgi:hypothetical protein